MFTNIRLLCVIALFCAFTNAAYRTPPDKDDEPYKPMPLPKLNPVENDMKYWQLKARDILKTKLDQKLNTNTAKNIIFFLGDGMSIPTITAARIYQGQLKNTTGEEEQLFFETFPHTGLSKVIFKTAEFVNGQYFLAICIPTSTAVTAISPSSVATIAFVKTYCTDVQVADSACTATAYLSGVKTNVKCIGVSANVKVADCEAAKMESNRPTSILKWAQDAGKGTGVVTNTRITHASPAGTYAHVPYRDMECDADVVRKQLDPLSCDFDIAKQLVYDDPGRNIKVLLGGGRSKFLPKNETLSAHGTGSRLDEDLIQKWQNDKKSRNANASYITDVNQLKTLDIDKTDYLLGLFSAGHLAYHLDRNENQPTLDQMTETAIKILQKEPNGYFLFVEGGQIDFGHHANLAHKALDETVEFAKAIELAAKLTNEQDTLIVVTADHAHTMSMSGYPARGTDILGLYGKGGDDLPYSTLSYANGPGFKNESTVGLRYNLSSDDTDADNYTFPALVPRTSETHGGDDVAVYARGPWSHLFTGNYEQNYIPFAEAYAASIGPSANQRNSVNDDAAKYPTSYLLIFLYTLYVSFENIICRI